MAPPTPIQLDVEVRAAMRFPWARWDPDISVAVRKASSTHIGSMPYDHHLCVPVRRWRKRGGKILCAQRSVRLPLPVGQTTSALSRSRWCSIHSPDDKSRENQGLCREMCRLEGSCFGRILALSPRESRTVQIKDQERHALLEVILGRNDHGLIGPFRAESRWVGRGPAKRWENRNPREGNLRSPSAAVKNEGCAELTLLTSPHVRCPRAQPEAVRLHRLTMGDPEWLRMGDR